MLNPLIFSAAACALAVVSLGLLGGGFDFFVCDQATHTEKNAQPLSAEAAAERFGETDAVVEPSKDDEASAGITAAAAGPEEGFAAVDTGERMSLEQQLEQRRLIMKATEDAVVCGGIPLRQKNQ